MKYKIQVRICSFIMIFALVAPIFLPPASAAPNDLWFTFLDELMLKDGATSIEMLESYRDKWNAMRFWGIYEALVLGPAAIELERGAGRLRLINKSTRTWITRTDGGFPYTVATGDVPAELPDISNESANQWVGLTTAEKCRQFLVLSDTSFSDTLQKLNGKGITCTRQKISFGTVPYYVLMNAKRQVYCNSLGHPYVTSATPAAADNSFDYIVNNNPDNSITIDTPIINMGDEILNVLNDDGTKTTYNIDNLTYDASTHSYTANTYNVVNNTYNYYTWNITYNISNTYVTYIGSNAAYQQEQYKYYYELPDGRSSEDLTADDIAGMSFQFHDVVNYARSATDTSLRALYHFDGAINDAGYFGTQTAFTWRSGASIAYMDSAIFKGALYLDETAHAFDITLPSNLGSGDFSLQFRHYQASQPDTLSNINNSLSLGGTTVLTWDERNFYFNGTTVPVPIGNWAELAFIRNNGTLYFYINGLRVASRADTTGYAGKVSFGLGITSRAYTMLDELRVVNFAVAKAGASYAPATAPYDTNLVLVLPDGAFPIADEYWKFNDKGNLFEGRDFTGGGLSLPSGWQARGFCSPLYNANSISVRAGYYDYDYDYNTSDNGLAYSAPRFNSLSDKPEFSNGNYVFSVMLSDGKTYSFPFSARRSSDTGDPPYYLNIENGPNRVNFQWGSLIFVPPMYGGFFQIRPKSGVTIEVLYVELVAAPAANTGHEKVSCIYPSTVIQPNTAAVQSSIPVMGYTVGGVRPTFPVRGDVWLPVEGRRITGCYIYSGTMWEKAGCRYYTGKRWIPIYALDIITLEDCWDIADKEDATPPIVSQEGFWNWWKKEWKDFRAWMAGNAGGGSGGIISPPENCTHTYIGKIIQKPTCVLKGSKLLSCKQCGDTKTEEVPANGHDWLSMGSVADELDANGVVVTKGYDLYECSICKQQYKDFTRLGPPAKDGGSSITNLVTSLFDSAGKLSGKLIAWLLALGTQAIDGFSKVTDFFAAEAAKVDGFGGGFLLFLSGAFALIPPDLMACITLALVCAVLGMIAKNVFMK